jgi:hypothetical protein
MDVREDGLEKGVRFGGDEDEIKLDGEGCGRTQSCFTRL